MGLGHVPQEPVRAEGEGADVQGRQRRGAAQERPVDLSRRARGRFGEDLAARAYVRAGGQVLDRNWRVPGGELDLVVALGRLTVFVEVKARANDRYGGAAAAVDARKQRRIRRLAASWLAQHPDRRGELRFDVVTVTGVRVEVIESAF